MNVNSLPVAVIGAGPVGLAAAAHLHERGIQFVVFEVGDEVAASIRERRWAATLQLAEQFGRDPDALHLVVRADPRIVARPGGRHRPAFTGSCAEVMHDIEAAHEIGATEILDFHASANSVDELVESAQCLAQPMLAAA